MEWWSHIHSRRSAHRIRSHPMKIAYNTKVFLAFLAVMFALQAGFDGRRILNAVTSDALETVLQRLAIAALFAAGATFLWNLVRREP